MPKYSAQAIAAAIACQDKTNVPAVVTLAQFDIESSCGKHEPAGSNNPFGIKATKGQPFVSAMTWEVVRGQSVRVEQAFAKYPSLEASFEAHGAILNHPTYTAAMVEWLDGNLNAGIDAMAKHYATDPNYASKIKSVIKTDNLEVLVKNARNASSVKTASTSSDRAATSIKPAAKASAGVAAQSEGDEMEKLLLSMFTNFGSTMTALSTVGHYAPEVISGVAKSGPDLKQAGEAFMTLVADAKGGKYGNLMEDASGLLKAGEKVLEDFGVLHDGVATGPATLADAPSVATLKQAVKK